MPILLKSKWAFFGNAGLCRTYPADFKKTPIKGLPGFETEFFNYLFNYFSIFLRGPFELKTGIIKIGFAVFFVPHAGSGKVEVFASLDFIR